MIDPSKPYNDLPLLPPVVDADDVDILKLVNRANLALSKLDGRTISTFNDFSNAILLADTFTVREAVDSSGVENIITTVKEALESRVLSIDELSPEQKETNRYSHATSKGKELLKEHDYLSTNDFIAIQKELRLALSGIRALPGYVIADKKTGKIYYSPPEGEKLIRDLLKNFEDYFNNKNEDPDPLIKMAILHYQFEAIHPFPDGNGRTGRILMTLYLMGQGRLRFPVLFLSDYILNHKTEYYAALRAVTYEGKWKEWIEYILTAVLTQADKTTYALDQITVGKIRMGKKLPKGIPHFRRTDLLDYLFTTAMFSREQMALNLDIHVNTASTYLRTLVKAGLVDVVRHKNTKVFFVPAFVNILKQ